MRERDFGDVRHVDGISPAWPVSYAEFEPYYAQAETLFAVHGNRGEDPHEPWSSGPYDHPAVSHEPRIQKLSDDWAKVGLNPYHLPLGIKLDERDGRPTPTSICIRCGRLRRVPLPAQRQGRRAGDDRRSDAGPAR